MRESLHELIAVGRELDRQAALAGAHGAAYEALRTEFLAAAGTPARPISTPAFGRPTMPFADVINDAFAGADGAEALQAMLALMAEAARGVDVRRRAAAWLEQRADVHARYHCGDLAIALLEDDEEEPRVGWQSSRLPVRWL